MRYVGIFLVVFLSRSVIPSYSSTETDGNQQSEGYFHCDDNRSLEFAQYCDKEVDCADKTDERDCDYDACTLEASRKFRCKNNRKCVLSDFVCDGVFDCPDRSDESDCGNKTKKAYCHDGWFACKDSSHCVPATYRCDGHPECSDKSDEKDCHNILHGVLACVDKFKCMDATCLADDKFVCDGTKDCANGLDESDETCRSHPDCKDCKDICVRHEHGVTCSCRSGFEFGDDKVTCQDIDECKLNFCSQNCENTPGSFVCSCEPGYNLVNGTKCESLTKPTYVWYRGVRGSRAEIIVDRDGRTRKIRLPPSKTHVPNIIIPPMDIDIYNEKLYFRSKNLLFELDMKYPTHAPRRIALPDVDLTHFAIDFATGNVYFTKDAGTKISVCQPEHSCASLISDRSSEISGLRIAHLVNGSRLFWTEGSSTIMSSSLDGLQVSKVYQTSRRQRLSYYLVDPRSNKLYVAHNYLVEVDLSSLRTRKVTKIEFANSTQLLWNMAVDDDTLLLQIPEWKFQGAQNWKFIVYKIDLRTGDHIGHMKTRGDLILHSVHRPSEIRPQNPCHASLCSHTCVSGTSPRWFKCLCPPGMILDEDDERNCVVKQNQELIYFVNGSLFSTYVYENELLSLSSILDIQDQPLAITADSDMGLIYSTHRGLYLLTAEGRTKEIGSNLRDIRSLAYDYLDNVLYAVDNLELLAINLKTSAIALIETNTNVVNLDIDVKNRVLFVETRDSKLSSMIIGNWEYIFFNRIIHPTHDIQKNWVFDPYEIKIRLNSSIVLNNGFCDLSHDGEIGFACQPHSKLLPRCDHSDHETRLLAVFTPRSDSSKSKRKTACDSVSCNFCVSDPDNQAVCMCPYGHEIGADGKSCTETCGAQMLRCNAPKDKCIHKSKKCDGFDDCSDGSDEKNCDEHNCGDNFKCASNNVCIMRKYRCDGQNDCTDGSDEKNCPFRNCTSSQFQCKDQSCIDLTKKCDGEDDCLFGEDEEKCPEVICKKDEFDCGNRKCIPKDWQCDDNIDCPSGIDELNCSSIPHEIQSSHKKKKCDSNWNFCCGSGELLSLELRCNGAEECNDGSDEHNCTLACASPNFRCKDGQCLTERQVCDGISDCSDADDERNCRNRCQQKDLFECISDGKCVPRGVVCDGRKDCSDASDESEDICPPPTTEKPSCFAGDFKCDSGQCIEFSQVCDGVSQCADGSDEGVHCPAKLNCQRAGCSHSCYLSGSEVRCSCPAGFRLSEGGLSCVDIDECLEIPAKCSQKCHNLKGSYSCSCAPGFRLNFKGECRVESGEPVILVVDNEVVETVSENNDRRIVFDAQNSHIGGVEYDHVSELVFVSDTNNNKVHRIPLNNLNPGFKHEVYTQVKPGVLALDYVTDNLYYADYRPSIHVCTRAMAGAYCTMLTEVNFKPEPGLPAPEILSLVVVPLEGIMFYSESETGFIFRVNMDGSNKSTFAWPSREKKPLSLTVDHVRKTLYWIDAHSGFIEHSDFEGGNIRRLPQRWGYWQTFALFEDYLYIPEPYRHQWIIMHKITGKIKSSMASLRGRLTDIKIMHRVNQPPGENRCSAKKCQQICLLRPNGSTCACKDGQRLAADNVSCTEVDFNWGELHDQHWASKLKEECSCENGGKCTVSSMMNRQFFCKCPPGFHGERCEFGATKSLVLTVVMVALVFTLVAIAGILLIIIVAKRDRISRHFRRQTCQGGDKRNLIVEGNEDENLY